MSEPVDADWIEAIRAAVGCDVAQVRSTLAKFRIQAQAAPPRAKKLNFTKLTFSGERRGTDRNGPFELTWSISSGLYAVMSDGNFKGKSSILNLLQASVRGDFPGKVDDAVWSWLTHIGVCFSIDHVEYAVDIKKDVGEVDAGTAQARVYRKAEDWLKIFEGSAGPDLKQFTEALMMEELGFQPIYAHASGDATAHAWPLYASTLFLSSTSLSSALFGDVPQHGIPLKLLQLFIGLPWVTTYSAASVVHKMLAEQRTGPKVDHSNDGRLSERLTTVEQELVLAREVPKSTSRRGEDRNRLFKLDAEVVADQKVLVTFRRLVETLEERRDVLASSHAEAKRQVQQIKDEQAAGYVFRKLKPTCCPACEAEYDAVTAAVVEKGTCALCKVDIKPSEADEDETKLVIADQNLADVATSVMTVRAELSAAERSVRAAESDLRNKITELDELQASLSAPVDDTEVRITRLEAQAEQLRELLSVEASASSKDAAVPIEEQIIKAAEAEAKKRMLVLQEDVLRDVSSAVLSLSQQFGIPNLTAMRLDNGGKMHIEKGGIETFFSKMADGERLRIKIAMALAAVEVARKRGHGRHPGLLVIDSPAREEVVDKDFETMIANVASVAKDMGGVQVLIGTVARPELDAIVPVDHRLHAEGDNYLF